MAMGTSSLLFGLAHIPFGDGTLRHGLMTGSLGVVCGILKEKYGILSSICAHEAYNCIRTVYKIVPITDTKKRREDIISVKVQMWFGLRFIP